MNTGTGIVILAGWILAAASAASPAINERGYKESKRIAWALTALALAWEAAVRLG